MATGRLLGSSVASGEPRIGNSGHTFNVTLDFQKIPRTVPAWMPWVPIVSSNDMGKYVPLFPFCRVASCTTTSITADSATEANWFDPADTADNNKWWLIANGGAQTATYWDLSADCRIFGQTISTLAGGALYSESKAISSVSGTGITLSAAFTADPADTSTDVLLPGGINASTLIIDQAVIIGEEINVAEINLYGADWDSSRAAYRGVSLRYDDLPMVFKTLISYGVIPQNGCKLFSIDHD